jgi:hypothetical protein
MLELTEQQRQALPPEGAEHHLVTVRVTLDEFGIADPTAFAAKLQKAG